MLYTEISAKGRNRHTAVIFVSQRQRLLPTSTVPFQGPTAGVRLSDTDPIDHQPAGMIFALTQSESLMHGYSMIDDGRDRTLDQTIGINWYLSKRFRVMFNWVHTRYEKAASVGEADIAQIRAQYSF
jgi:hypothetical protein